MSKQKGEIQESTAGSEEGMGWGDLCVALQDFTVYKGLYCIHRTIPYTKDYTVHTGLYRTHTTQDYTVYTGQHYTGYSILYRGLYCNHRTALYRLQYTIQRTIL